MKAHKKMLNEQEFMNGRMLIGYGITVAVLFAAYLVELLKGNRTPGIPFDTVSFYFFHLSERERVAGDKGDSGDRIWNIICFCIVD